MCLTKQLPYDYELQELCLLDFIKVLVPQFDCLKIQVRVGPFFRLTLVDGAIFDPLCPGWIRRQAGCRNMSACATEALGLRPASPVWE
jgi:hypothetical protein